tara:strand:+ start:434 stop:694 length:261 start_codon:yes stop_codon:yes gene_type:complete
MIELIIVFAMAPIIPLCVAIVRIQKNYNKLSLSLTDLISINQLSVSEQVVYRARIESCVVYQDFLSEKIDELSKEVNANGSKDWSA